ncbi:acyl-ACP--UDP-N-acetylglucosamine O-acyltransferase [bacterium]|nr:acyl-ACP--UDP-N-acetylglucosamine O-acyltransferase [bacterium]
MSIHPTAVVDARAELDASVEVAPYAIIDGPVRIAAGCHIGPHCHLLGHTTIGPGCRIHTGAVIGDLPQDRSFAGGDSAVAIGAETIIREYVTIHRGTKPGTMTVVGDRCMIMAHAHVAHNCQVGNDVILVNGSLLAGHVTIGDRVVLSGNAAVHQFCRVGELAMIGGLSKITQDIPPFLMFDGHGLCVGMNVIGMRRAGLNAAERAEIKVAYRRLYRTAGSMSAAVDELASQLTTPAGLRLLNFLQAPSKRGIHGHSEQEAATIPLPTVIPQAA